MMRPPVVPPNWVVGGLVVELTGECQGQGSRRGGENPGRRSQGGAGGEVVWRRGGDESKSGVSSRILKSVFVSFQVIFVKVEVKTSLLSLSVHFHFLFFCSSNFVALFDISINQGSYFT